MTNLSVSARHIGQRGSALDTHFAQPKTWPHAFEPYSASSSQQYTQQNVGAPPSSFSQVNAPAIALDSRLFASAIMRASFCALPVMAQTRPPNAAPPIVPDAEKPLRWTPASKVARRHSARVPADCGVERIVGALMLSAEEAIALFVCALAAVRRVRVHEPCTLQPTEALRGKEGRKAELG